MNITLAAHPGFSHSGMAVVEPFPGHTQTSALSVATLPPVIDIFNCGDVPRQLIGSRRFTFSHCKQSEGAPVEALYREVNPFQGYVNIGRLARRTRHLKG